MPLYGSQPQTTPAGPASSQQHLAFQAGGKGNVCTSKSSKKDLASPGQRGSVVELRPRNRVRFLVRARAQVAGSIPNVGVQGAADQ
ncbi:hypothetical protein MDA_GLEAN10005048 [Myotis davidii]|uniref:Uncharacterized protein n=1 Tax=Myotis davidii TaxID=225400 RepID=L5LDA4_MYODS|nr:hypothetical protein MDA_GLEAN10005048 [Myotis davidii]